MADFTINMTLKERPAIYTPPIDRPKFGVKKGQQYNVGVLGIYQVSIEEEIDAYFVIVLPTGQCTYAGVDQIRFTDCGVPEDGESDV